jgi:hypothetical protein
LLLFRIWPAIGDATCLAGLSVGIPSASPLTTVIHMAGTIDDGVTRPLIPPKSEWTVFWALMSRVAVVELPGNQFAMFRECASMTAQPAAGRQRVARRIVEGF